MGETLERAAEGDTVVQRKLRCEHDTGEARVGEGLGGKGRAKRGGKLWRGSGQARKRYGEARKEVEKRWEKSY